MKQFVVFKLRDELYGVPIMQVQEIIQYSQMTRLPGMPDFIEGVLNLRGKIVPVLHLRRRFSMPLDAGDQHDKIIVMNLNSQPIGLIVDSVRGVVNLVEESIDALPESLRSIDKDYLSGVGKNQNELIILLDVEKIISDFEKRSLEKLK